MRFSIKRKEENENQSWQESWEWILISSQTFAWFANTVRTFLESSWDLVVTPHPDDLTRLVFRTPENWPQWTTSSLLIKLMLHCWFLIAPQPLVLQQILGTVFDTNPKWEIPIYLQRRWSQQTDRRRRTVRFSAQPCDQLSSSGGSSGGAAFKIPPAGCSVTARQSVGTAEQRTGAQFRVPPRSACCWSLPHAGMLLVGRRSPRGFRLHTSNTLTQTSGRIQKWPSQMMLSFIPAVEERRQIFNYGINIVLIGQ